MRDHWSKGPANLKTRIQDLLDNGEPYGAVLEAFNEGYDFPPDEIATPHLKRLETLPVAERGQYSLRYSDKLESEEQALHLSTARRAWAKGPSKAEERAAEQKAKEAEEKAQARAVAARVKQLEGEEQAKQRQRLQEQAERELAGRSNP